MVSGRRTIQTRWLFIHFSETSPTVYSVGLPALKLVGGSKSTRGKSILKIAPPEAAKQVRIAPQAASETRSRRDQMKLPLSVSGMPGFPPGIQLPGKVAPFPCMKVANGQAALFHLRQTAAR